MRGRHEPPDCGSSRARCPSCDRRKRRPSANPERAILRTASPADIPSTGPAKDCELSSRAALEKWIADRHAKARKAIPLDSKLAAAYVGRYQLPHRVVTVTEESGHLYIDVPEGDRSELFAEAPSQFFLKIRPWTLTFVKEGSQVTRLDIRDGGEVMSGRRVD